MLMPQDCKSVSTRKQALGCMLKSSNKQPQLTLRDYNLNINISMG